MNEAPAHSDDIQLHARQLDEAIRQWDSRGWPRPAAVVVSGSGLAVDLGPAVHGPMALHDLLPFDTHPVEGHPNEAEILMPVDGRPVLYLRGRLHSYQGYSAHQTAFAVRLAGLLGAQVLILTNAAGGLQPHFQPGQLKQITDHINFSGLNPLRGELPTSWGPRFPDMTEAYDQELRALIRRRADELGVGLGEGVYAMVAGPSYETPSEVRMLRGMGADLCGMSTVLEVIAGRHLGLRCAAISLVTNPGAGVVPGTLDHEEVLEAGKAAAGDVQRLLQAVLADPELIRDA